MSVLFLFIDGIGLADASEFNPFSERYFPGFNRLTSGRKVLKDGPAQPTPDAEITSSFGSSPAAETIADKSQSTSVQSSAPVLFKSIDALLGVDGLPQSGTGQASLFSGENAASLIGRHFGPFPHSGTKVLLQERSLFHKAASVGLKPHFINAFPDVFFQRAEKRNRWSCATLMTRSAGLHINSLEEVRQGSAVTAEILQDYWQSLLNVDIPSITYGDAARRVVASLNKYDIVLMEYYLTDKAGHSRNMVDAVRSIERIDGFITALLDELQAGNNHTLVVTSDHGNVEDLSVKTHTYNPVPLIVSGPHAAQFNEITDLTGVTPAILSCFQYTGNY